MPRLRLLGTYGGIRQYIAGANGLLDDRMRVVTGDERRSEFSEVMDLLGVDEWEVIRFHPNFYVDISEFIDVKRKALGTYVSQLPVDTRDDEAQLDSHSSTYGTHISVRFAEAFHALRLAV